MNRKNKRRVFVTGAGGFIGANLTRKLLKQNFNVHILCRTEEISWRLRNVSQLITIHVGDITNFKLLHRVLQKAQPDYIIHLAAYGAYHYQTDLNKIIKVNIEGTKNLLEASKNIAYKCFINTGSSSEYGFKDKPMKEDDFCNPVSFYGTAKLTATQMCKVFAQINNKPIITLRLFSVYGPYEERGRFVPIIIKSLIIGDTINLTQGNIRRDFIYIDDVSNAYIKALDLGFRMRGKILNIGVGKEYTNDQLVKKLFKITNKKTRIEKGAYPKRAWDTKHWRADISNAKKILSWNPKFDLTNGLLATYSWFEKNLDFYN
ncbi:MAG: NAD-dependent epimerase/dehydratase family protein [Patescibacteria group bacterium]|nr:NAD-dependent epimerase/dehydratase family protein [Actinomycetota bacterium]MCL5438468.1 NAD-dependent epimerase/dehydratase family protein [Patescibacteria group bacterium]